MPVDSFSRAQVRMIDDYIDLHLSRAIVKVLIKRRKKEEVTAEETQALKAAVARVEAYLGDGKFLVGGAFSLADCAFMPAAASLGPLGFGELLETPRLKPYVERLRARAGYKGASLLELD
jgi:glutathione S-transferase